MTKIVGTIPEKIIYIHAYDEELPEKRYLGICRPAYVSDAVNNKTIETGKRWALGYNYNHRKEEDIILDEFENNPFSGVKLFELEKRSEGGRAYKVLVHDKYYVDFREDVLVDCMLNARISGQKEYALIEGEFIFARVGAEMKLVRIGSDLHNELIQSTQEKTKKKISKLEIGKLYSSRNSESAIYCGQAHILSFDFDIRYAPYGYSYRPNIEYIYADHPEIIKMHMWLRWNTWNKLEDLDDIKYGVYFTKSHSFINESDKVIIKPELLTEKIIKYMGDYNNKISQNFKVEKHWLKNGRTNIQDSTFAFMYVNYADTEIIYNPAQLLNNSAEVIQVIDKFRKKLNAD